MRVLIVLAGLLAAPLVVAAAQGKAQRQNAYADPANCGQHLAFSANSGRQVPAHGGVHGVMDYPCEPVLPPPPPPPAPGTCSSSAPAAAGSGAVNGGVYSDGWASGLEGWCVELTGPVTATAVTDASGGYRFVGLPDGEYTICEVMKSGWTQTFPRSGPQCPTGLGYNFSLVGGTTAWFVDFTNRAP
jgi:hypothetical protein